LVTTYFARQPYSAKRAKELIETLKRNLHNQHIAAVHVLTENADPTHELADVAPAVFNKLIVVHVDKQPTYGDFFTYANSVLGSNVVTIVANADIYFDATLSTIQHRRPNEAADLAGDAPWRSVFALSRQPSPDLSDDRKYDYQRIVNLCETYAGSHDAFVFATPVPDSVLSAVDHSQNNMGAENVVIHAFQRVKGYRLSNPCSELHAFHAHGSRERDYDNNGMPISDGRYGAVRPGKLDGVDDEVWRAIF